MAPTVRKATTARPQTIGAYLATVRADQQAALERLRRIIRTAVPRAEECITYAMPGFRLDGKAFVAFAAAAHHCSFFPMSGAVVAAHQTDLKGYDTSKGTIRFQPDKPLPATLIRKLLKARIAQMAP